MIHCVAAQMMMHSVENKVMTSSMVGTETITSAVMMPMLHLVGPALVTIICMERLETTIFRVATATTS